MLPFIIGVIVGSIVSFFVFAICSMAGTDDQTDAQCNKRTGKDHAGK